MNAPTVFCNRGDMVRGKTKCFLKRKGTTNRRHMKPGFINGDIYKRPYGVVKVFFYHFDKAGDLIVTLVPRDQIVLANDEFKLEG